MEHLSDISTLPPSDAKKKECKKELKKLREKLFDLQNIFYADGRQALLIVLQGLDTSGKDGVVRHVIRAMNPMGVNIKAFQKPTEEEQKHDFLWRIYPHLPPKGMIQVFNRSHYEDVIVPTATQSLPAERIDYRLNLINRLETHFIRNDIHILKFFLHISKEEQKEKIENRLKLPHKRWKYDKSDEKVNQRWEDYVDIYDGVIRKSNDVPWHIIPVDKRWYRNYKVARTLVDYMENMDLRYPSISL